MTTAVTLAGRVRELQTVSGVLCGTADRPALLILGEAGIGKSRLLAAAIDEARSRDIPVFAGWCLALSDGLPLLPINGILHALQRADGGELLTLALKESPPYVQAEIARLLPEIAPDGGPGTHPPLLSDSEDRWLRLRLFEAVRRLLADVAAQRPVAVAVEDVHWADEATLELLDFLLSPSDAPPSPLVVTCRADEQLSPAVHAWVERATRNPRVSRLDLPVLTQAETAQQIELLIGARPEPAFVETTYARSEGNAFFTEQLVTAVVQGARPETLPAGLTSLLLARTAGVEGVAGAILETLTLARRPLIEASLCRVCATPADLVRGALRELVRARLLRSDERSGTHRLSHALLGEAIEHDILPGRRAELHGALADALIEAGDDALAAEIADHLMGAAKPVEELRWRVRAARQAESFYAWESAAEHWRRAITLVERGVDVQAATGMILAALYGAAEDAFDASGDEAEALLLAEQALQRLADSDTATRAEALSRAGWCRVRAGDMGGVPLLEEAITLFDQLPPSKAHVRAIRHLYLALSDNGQPHAAQEMLKRAAAVAEQAGDRPAQLEVLGLLAALNIDDDGVRRLEALRNELTDADPPEVHVELAVMQLFVLAVLARYEEVRDVGLPVIEYAAEHGLRTEHFEIAALYENVAEALLHLGDIEQAAAVIDPVTEDALAASNKMLHTTRAHLDLLRNQAMRAEQQWRALYAVGWASLIDEACAAVWRVEFLIWQAQLADALTLGKSILLRLRETPPETYDQFLDFARPLLLLGQRACADLAEQARARRSEDLLARAFDESQAFAELRDGFEVDPFCEEAHHSGPAETLQWDAELTRLAGSSDAAQWRLTADAWHRLGRPQYAAYAQWREAEALLTARRDRSLARSALWDASRAAAGHQPLVDAISALARRARIDLHERSADEADIGERAVLLGDGTRPYGLTDRELAVLHLLAEGKTNTEIGAALYMSGKTASVHVTHILRKLGVTTRVQAATVAERLGLLDTADL